MGQLALGLAGAGIGFAVGGPTGAQIGWMLGGFAWNLLDPPKIQGPRLQDTKVRGADYGTMRPILYGMARIGGLGMGQGSTSDGPNKFTEHEETSGGKGGPEVTNYRYTLSFFNEICEGPIVGVQRRWANGRLITEAGAESNDSWPFTLYKGDTTQTPDPTMETIYGTGEVAPMRGVAYESVEEVDVGDFGNARPNVEYEAFTAGGDIPWRVSDFSAWGTPLHSNFYHACATFANGVITAVEMGNGATDTFRIRRFRLDGTQIGSTIEQACPLPGTTAVFAVTNANIFMRTDGADDYWFYWNDTSQAIEQGFTIAGNGSNPTTVGAPMIKIGDSIYSVGHSGFDWSLSRWSAETAAGGALVDTVPVRTATSGYSFAPSLGTSSEDNVLYLLWEDSDGFRMRKVDATDLSTIHTWEPSDLAGTYLEHQGITFHVEDGLICNGRNVSSGVYQIRLVQIDGSYGLSNVGSTISTTDTVPTQSIWLGGGLLLDPDGVYSINPPPVAVILGDIVEDLCVRAGLDAAQVDVTDLTQEVRGFVVGAQMTARNAIDVLRKAFFFDAAEYDGKLVFRNRGHDAIATIPDGDLAAHEPGSEAPEPLEVTRVPEAELPRTVFVNFYNVDNDYQQGSQYWRRTVTRSQSDVTLDLQVVMTATEAMQCAQWHMHFAWLERDRFTFYTTRKWSKLTPTDVVVVRGVNIRITTKVEEPNGRIKFEGVRAFAGAFTSGGPVTEPIDGGTGGSGGGGQPNPTTPTGLAGTNLVLLDIPILSQGDYPYGFYAAMAPFSPDRWPGAGLYKSLDGGTSWKLAASTTTAAVIGTITADSLASYGGGETVDESTCTVLIRTTGATLESITGTALTNGGNLCAIRSGSTWELCNFRDAVLVDPATYELTGFKRGRKGTTTAGHADGDTFVLLPCLNVDAPSVELNVALKYKAVTYGTAIADAIEVDFTNTGESLTGWGGGTDPVLPSNEADYVLLSSDTALPNGRVLTAGTNVTLDDDGPGSTITIDVSIPPSSGGAMTLISSVTTSGSQASVTFSSIPGTYKHLMLVFQARDTNSSNGDGSSRMVINADTTAANYSNTQYTIGSGSTTTTATAAANTSGIIFANIPGVLSQANAFSAGHVYLPNYAGTTFWKGFVTRYESVFASTPTLSAGVMSGVWKSTSAVTSITINCSYTAFVNGSVFTLYGLG